jgi:hypothetical protein
LFYWCIDTTAFGYGAADIFGILVGRCETEGNFYGVYDSRSELISETQDAANLTANQYPIYSGPNAIPLDETQQEMSELLYRERDLEDEPLPSYEQAMADPTPSISTPIDRLENVMALTSPDQIQPIENAISLQAVFAPSHGLFHPSVEWTDGCYVDTSQLDQPQTYELTSHNYFGFIYPPYRYPLDT